MKVESVLEKSCFLTLYTKGYSTIPTPFMISFSSPVEYRRKRPICENALVENALFFLLFTTVYFFFFSSSFLFFSFLVLFFLVIYVHSRVSSSVVSGVHYFFAGLYSHEITPESWTWPPPWIRFTRVSAHAMSL